MLGGQNCQKYKNTTNQKILSSFTSKKSGLSLKKKKIKGTVNVSTGNHSDKTQSLFPWAQIKIKKNFSITYKEANQ